LLEQLNQIKVEEKEMRKKKKEEKKEACKMTCKDDSSSSSSESSGSDCEEPQILQFSDLKTVIASTVTVPNSVSTVPAPLSLPTSPQALVQAVPVEDISPLTIEVCMGGKCKKTGSMDLLHEFEKKVGGEGRAVVVGCKCMGKCKEGPNVRVSSCGSGTTGTAEGNSARVLRDQLCIGVGLDDVGSIVAHFFGEKEEENDAGSLILA
jgi:diacylglycerol O-acyltransferase 3, plant